MVFSLSLITLFTILFLFYYKNRETKVPKQYVNVLVKFQNIIKNFIIEKGKDLVSLKPLIEQKFKIKNFYLSFNGGEIIHHSTYYDCQVEIILRKNLIGGMDQNKKEKKEKIHKNRPYIQFYIEKHNRKENEPDDFNELNEAKVKNYILSKDEYAQFFLEDQVEELEMNQFNYKSGVYTEEERRQEYDDNDEYIFGHNNHFYGTKSSKILKLGWNKLEQMKSTLVKCIMKLGEGYMRIYPLMEQIKWVVKNDDNQACFSRIISIGTRVCSGIKMNRIKINAKLKNLRIFDSIPTKLVEFTSNKHEDVGLLRALEEGITKDEISKNDHGATFIGIGENLRRFDDFPGIYLNIGQDPYDTNRIIKYKALTVKSDAFLLEQAFEGAIDQRANDRYVYHSTDVLYYIVGQVEQFFKRERINPSVHYHTFNIYSSNDFEVNYDFAYIKRSNNKIIYKPNGNEVPYEHDNIKLFGYDINKDFLERIFKEGTIEYEVDHQGVDIHVLRAYLINKYQAYITIKMYRNNDHKIRFRSRSNTYENKDMLYENKTLSKDLDELKMIKIEESQIDNYLFDKFKTWFDGNGALLDSEIYCVRETANYSKNFYFLNDEIIFLKNYKSDLPYDSKHLNNNIYKYGKYHVEFKISINKFNEIILLYRGMSIKANMIKNAIVSIINKGREDWHIEIDADYATILAILAARFVGKMNQNINKEVEINEDLYKDTLYKENKSLYDQIKEKFEEKVVDANKLIKDARSFINSTQVNKLIEGCKKRRSIKEQIIIKLKHLTMFIYYYYLFIQSKIIGLSLRQSLFYFNYSSIIEELYINNEYNIFGEGLIYLQKIINNDEVVKSTYFDVLSYITSYVKQFLKIKKQKLNKFKIIGLVLIIVGFLLLMISLPIMLLQDLLKFDMETELFKVLKGDDVRFSIYIIINIILMIITLYVNSLPSNIRTRINFILYPLFYMINSKLFALLGIINLIVIKRISPLTVLLYLIFRGVSQIRCYSNVEYLSKIVYNPGSCTMNDVVAMYAILKKMKNNFDEYVKENKLTPRIANKFKILNINEPKNIHPGFEPNKEPLVQKSFKIDGYLVQENIPLKLHTCFNCESEAVYRQVQSKLDYDDKIMEDFKNFIQPKIKAMIEEANYGIVPSLEEYYSKLGSKRDEFQQGYKLYQNGDKSKLGYRMHTKTDEKIYMGYSKFKVKARNISAQNKQMKLIMGVVCETLMSILDKQPWSGPGSNNEEKCKRFRHFMDEVMYDQGVLCADGSAFDSTQHAKIQEIVDHYAFKLIIDNNPELMKFADIKDLYEVCMQNEFTVYSKFYTYKIHGTQMTGRMNTCLGNTLRSWAYVEFIKKKMKDEFPWVQVNRIQEMVNGDDQIIFMPKKYMSQYEYIAYKYVYYPEDKAIKHGLGQIARLFDKYPNINGAEFLSCILLYNEQTGNFMMTRKLERFLQMTPFTYNNKFLDMKKFRLLNAELMIADATNILVSKPLKVFREYANKMLEIGEREKTYLLSNFTFSAKDFHRISKNLNKIRFYLKFKQYYGTNSIADEFEDKYKDYLMEYFKINDDDLNEYFEVLSKINEKNFLEKFQCHIVDKLLKVTKIEQYESCVKEINKTRVEVELKLVNNKIKVNMFD